ncbi:rod shape-determining protein RodA [Sulfidibacter corallicola]|uniref:Cell wall polymerase n=1 Tax=Sulfidibacter corallicola TaxID=2818388 RepID=A0A8A4TCF1_SULCO|nr:rod shape-determining protein RodA [Sulfidibacter corallicola]QTD47779.1 rod shape-determining protein RodA [Sulfidibacter corallicola]
MNRFSLLDRGAFLVTMILCCLGVVFIHSATRASTLDANLWIKQMIWVCLGMLAYLVLSQFDYKKLVTHANVFYIAGIISLALVLLYGDRINGARSWFRLPFMSVQPSEFMKIATVLMIAKYFSRFQERQSSLLEFLVSSILIGIPFFLIILQPDMGTALVYVPFFVIPNFLVGNKESIWVTVAGSMLVVILILGVVFKPDWVFFLKDYQKNRIVSFIYPDRDTSNTGYQVHQSKISIGQGGLLGKGLGKGQQTQMGFLPAQHNDFILAVASEEVGFVGVALVFALFLVLFMRAFTTALEASDAMGSILVMLVIGTLFTQTLFNAAMLIGLVPTTGIPFPLLSYGGSSLLTSLSLLGLIQSVRTHRFVNH